MKKFLVSITLICSVYTFSFSQTVTSMNIIPDPATSADNLMAVVTMSFPGGPCSMQGIFNQYQSGDTIVFIPLYCYESNSGGCTTTDSFSIGQKPAGNYVFRLEFMSTTTAAPCGSIGYQLMGIEFTGFTVDVSTDVARLNQNASVNIYPNPVKNIAVFSFENLEFAETLIQVIDITGKTVMTNHFPLNSGEMKAEVDFSSLGSGIYFYHVSANGKTLSGKLVKAD